MGDGQIHLAVRPSECIAVSRHGANSNELEVRDCETDATHSASFHVGPQDCRWNEWFMWSACSTTCGFGTKRRSRLVKGETFDAGGKPCDGNGTETQFCLSDPCSSCR